MKNILFLLLFSTICFAPGYSEWTEIIKNEKAVIFINYSDMRKEDNSVFWWATSNYLQESYLGALSFKIYRKGNCKSRMFKILSYSFHTKPMGKGKTIKKSTRGSSWKYPAPASEIETQLKLVCNVTR